MRPSFEGRPHESDRGRGESHNERHGNQQQQHGDHDSHHKYGDATDDNDLGRKIMATSDSQQAPNGDGDGNDDGAGCSSQRIAGVVSLAALIIAWVAQSEVSLLHVVVQ